MTKSNNLDEPQGESVPSGIAPEAAGESNGADRIRGDATDFGVVAIGASAGGVEALTELFHELPAETGLAFVVIQHLHRDYKSFLRVLVERETSMRVVEASDGVVVVRNCVYVIPPGFDLSIHDGKLQVAKRGSEGVHRPFDAFLDTLASDCGERAIAVVLSGTGSDGASGIASVKAAGGVVIAQDPESLVHDGMPRSAIDTGMVDAVLPATGIASELARLGQYGDPSEDSLEGSADDRTWKHLPEVLRMLRLRSGNDFTHYKRASIERRVSRRVSLKGAASLADYVTLLRDDPVEQDALFQDILINVTSFFRDSDAFEALRHVVLPALARVEGRDVFPLRVWVPGCASGEEVYSIAISIAELMSSDSALAGLQVQIFGTDIDPKSIEKARQGIYPSSIEASVSRTRLARFFKPEPTGYKISASIRNMCVFAVQNVTKDPPFSKLDLVCCRNLMIYLGSSLQKRVLETFHYALRPGGFLMLGISESIGAHGDLFALKDGKHKIYSRKSTPDRGYRAGRSMPTIERSGDAPSIDPRPVPRPSVTEVADRLLMERYAPAGVLVDSDLKVIQFRGQTGRYLEPDAGAASLSLIKLARRDLAIPLRSAILEAGRKNQVVRRPHAYTPTGEATRRIVLDVTPLKDPSTLEPAFLVLFSDELENLEVRQEVPNREVAGDMGIRLSELERELMETREYMQSLLEAQEAANEELQSANEEVQSTNEELQSTNEELETAKEELQSTNEELSTVNDELEMRNRELIGTNSDLVNLLSSVNIPILMLQEDLRIRQFTRQAKDLLNLIDTDIGRPMTDIQMGLPIQGLDRIVLGVIENLNSQELEFTHANGRAYSLSIRPYRTADNRIAGAVLVILDVTDIQSLERARRLAAVVRDSSDAIIVWNVDGEVETWNPTAHRLYGWTEEEAAGLTVSALVPESELGEVKRFMRETVNHSSGAHLRTTRMTRAGEQVEVDITVSVLRDEGGRPAKLVSTERPVHQPEVRDE